jgi:hypothetical protein
MPDHILAVLRHENLKIGGFAGFEGVGRFLLSRKQRGEVLLHEGKALDEVKTDLLEVIEFFQKVAVLDAARDLGRIVQVRLLVVLEMAEKQFR